MDAAFRRSGFDESRSLGRPVAADGSPLPWFTYPAIEYLAQLDLDGARVFEYGSGNSSLFWARRGALVWSVEHDSAWYEEMSRHDASLQQLVLAESRDEYADALRSTPGNMDVVVIDGVFRMACAKVVTEVWGGHGLIILDNSDWYSDVRAFLIGEGLTCIDFSGFGPMNRYAWSTSILFQNSSFIQERLRAPHPLSGIDVAKGPTW